MAKVEKERRAPIGRAKEHELLLPSQGIWDLSYEKYMEGPDAAPIISKGVARNRLMVGGMWLLQDQRYDFPGGSWEGSSFYGYDPSREKFVATWVDTSNPHLSAGEGFFDGARTFTLETDGVNPTTGERAKVKHVKIEEDANTHIFSVYREMDGQDVKLLQVTFIRRESGRPAPVYDNYQFQQTVPGWEGVAWEGFEHDFPVGKPQAEHRLLKQEAGVWRSQVRIPGNKVDEEAIEINRILQGGLWLVSDVRGKLHGRPFQGRRLLGFDSDMGRYVGAWVDSTNPFRVVLEGTYDEGKRTLRLTGEGIDPRSQERVEETQEIAFVENGMKRMTLTREPRQEERTEGPELEVIAKRIR